MFNLLSPAFISPLLMLSSYTFIFMLFFSLLLMSLTNLHDPNWFSYKVKNAVKTAFLISLIPLSYFLNYELETIMTGFSFNSYLNVNLHLSMKFDFYSLMLSSVALYVTWAILDFALYYMHSDPLINWFMKCLLAFLMAMIFLVTADNFYMLFIAWEAVGIISFLLIGWWCGRADANTAAIQAVLYNRMGDVGLILALAWLAMNSDSWDISNLLYSSNKMDLTLPLFGLILAAMGKSAQFGLHPWLTSAMEGPTPVSALLHSSTMVVAGIYLLIRFSPALENNSSALTFCLCIGAITTLFAASCALTQNDFKKIVALSTSSQLGLMMVTIGLNMPQLAFFHICTHAFFKAMLFLCAGSVIHALNGEQDIRKMGGILSMAPITSSCLTIGCLSLMGFPFLSGFFSKDTILETLNLSYLNASALMATLIATVFTTTYSFRIIYFVVLGFPRTNVFTPLNENYSKLIKPLKRLAWGSLFAGSLLILNVLPYENPLMTMSATVKLTALLLMFGAGSIALALFLKTSKKMKYTPLFLSYHHFSGLLGGYPFLIHTLTPKGFLNLGQTIAKMTFDQTWYEKLGPKSLISFNMPLINITDAVQQGTMKVFLRLFLFTTSLAVVLLITPHLL